MGQKVYMGHGQELTACKRGNEKGLFHGVYAYVIFSEENIWVLIKEKFACALGSNVCSK